MAADYTPVPARTYPGVAAQTAAATRLVRTEGALRQAITLYKQKPSSLSAIQLAADIKLTSTLTLDADTAGVRGLVIDGAGQYEISNSGTFSPMFDIQADTKIKDLSITATGISTVFSITAGVAADLIGLNINTSNDGYLFSLPGLQGNTTISGCRITDDGTLSGLITNHGTPSEFWTMRDVKTYGVSRILNGNGQYLFITIDNLVVDPTSTPTGALLVANIGSSRILQTQNIKTINPNPGTTNEWINNLTTVSGSTILMGSKDIVLGANGYATTPPASGLYIGHGQNDTNGQSICFVDGFSTGNPTTSNDTIYEQVQTITNITVNAIQQTGFNFTALTDTAYLVDAEILARQTAGTSQCNYYHLRLKVKNNGGALTVGTLTTISIDEEVAGWDATIDTSGTSVRVRITGAAATNIRWGIITRIKRI